MTAPARFATLQTATQTETAQGGRVPVWTDAATLWVSLAPRSASADAAQEMRPVRLETATAAARDHPLAAGGQQLLAEGDVRPWRVLAVRRDTPSPGFMELELERTA